jgi:N6-L-threonylcarbamoyladenine synthase
VSPNTGLRESLKAEGANTDRQIFIPEFEYCTDNAAMIDITAHYKFLKGEFCNLVVAPVASLSDL